MPTLLGIYGAGGNGRVVMPLARAQYGRDMRLVFIDDSFADGDIGHINGHDAMNWEMFLGQPEKDKGISISIANSRIREKLDKRAQQHGVDLVDVRAHNVVQLDHVAIGKGALLPAFVTLTSNIRIGRAFQANHYAYVEHDCIIGDYVTFAPSVCCNGNIIIEDHVYIGTGAVIKQGTPDKPLIIGKAAVIGMGAVVTKNVEAGAVMVGNPARPMRK